MKRGPRKVRGTTPGNSWWSYWQTEEDFNVNSTTRTTLSLIQEKSFFLYFSFFFFFTSSSSIWSNQYILRKTAPVQTMRVLYILCNMFNSLLCELFLLYRLHTNCWTEPPFFIISANKNLSNLLYPLLITGKTKINLQNWLFGQTLLPISEIVIKSLEIEPQSNCVVLNINLDDYIYLFLGVNDMAKM